MLLSAGAEVNLDPRFSQPMHLGCERDQVRLYKVQTKFVLPLEAGERIAVSSRGHTQLVRGLRQLKGLVRITDGDAALRFIRLRTSPTTWHMWHDATAEVEIVAASRAPSLPTFGLRAVGQASAGHWDRHSSGMDGILSDEVCRAVGFGPPKVRRAAGGFTIERWIFAESGSPFHRSIQKVREFVGKDGEYQRTAIARVDPRRVDQLFIGRYE
jgi:hypothetical protein